MSVVMLLFFVVRDVDGDQAVCDELEAHMKEIGRDRSVVKHVAVNVG